MRRHQKRQIEDFIHLLDEAHASIRKALRSGERDSVLALLAQCQEGAVSAGTLIESVEGEGTPTVALLEDYCEQVYQCCEAVRRADPAMSGNRIYKTLSKSISGVKDSVERDLKTRVEVVFFPYQASMWDSLESVWRAADADPDCDAYVVPIPYYEKNPDGSLGQMHYEGNCYPSCVSVVDWRTYDLEKRRPDAAFIHNPYDDQNLVTQVHEMYFSESLKKYVGLLCYIPYFVAARGTSSHFAYMPGVINSDFTIVESETVRREYLSVWEQLAAQKAVPSSALEIMGRKILALGSPKYDAVLNSGGKAYEVPEEWRRLLYSADGSRKKVIFYNTSVGKMLENASGAEDRGENLYLQKIESVLLYFKRQESVVLLWRPHPLMEQTMASMRPEIYEEYCEIVREYKEAGYGIYDDSADLYRAIAISDAYYGDGSSVMYLWEKTGKPLLLGNPEITSYRRCLPVGNLYFDGVSLWCTASDFNGLFRISPDTLTVDNVGRFPGEKQEGCYLFGKMTECGEKLYFAPQNAESIEAYDKKTGEFFSVAIPESGGEKRLNCKYYEAFTCGDSVYFAGSQVNAILRVESLTNHLTVYDGWKRRLEARVDDESAPFFSGVCQIGRKAYLTSKYANAILCFDLLDHHWDIVSLPEPNRYYTHMVRVESAVWLASNGRAAVGIYDPLTGGVMELDVPDLFAKGFISIETDQKFVYCFSRHLPKILKIDVCTHQIQVLPGLKRWDVSAAAGGNIYSISRYSGEMLRFCPQDCTCQADDLKYPLSGVPRLSGRQLLEGAKEYCGLPRETAGLHLDSLVEAVLDGSPEHVEQRGNCGEEIYQYIKKVIS